MRSVTSQSSGSVDGRGPEQHRGAARTDELGERVPRVGPDLVGERRRTRRRRSGSAARGCCPPRTRPADRSARAKRGCRAAPCPRWCHGDARRTRDFRPSRPYRRRRLHDRRGRDRARARRRRCATRSGGWSASCTSSRRGPRPKATRPGACTTCSRRTRCSRRCRCTRACCRSSNACSTAGACSRA